VSPRRWPHWRYLEANAEFVHDLGGVGQHVDQVRNRRALVAGHVIDARLQQRLGDGQNALTTSFLNERSAMT
jgi:hypothetical protein